MSDRYLKADPLPWLCDGENEAVSYLVRKESDNDADSLYRELENSGLAEYLNSISSDGILGDRKNPDLFYRGTVWFFLYASQCGFTFRTPFMRSTADYIVSMAGTDSGGFSFSWKDPEPVGCRTGDIVRALVMCGAEGESVDKGIDWIVNNQRHDGGWLHCPISGFPDIMKMVVFNRPGRGLKREKDGACLSCPVASLSCASALLLHNRNKHKKSIEAAADFFLSNNLFLNHKFTDCIKCGLNGNFRKSGFPVMSQYDAAAALNFIFNTSFWRDSRAAEPFNFIIGKQNSDGTWNNENEFNGMVKEGRGKGRWVTLAVLQMLSSLRSAEGQLENA